MEKIAVYPGTFDPITNGHLDIIERALPFFDKIYILIAKNPSKKTLLKLEERRNLIESSLEALASEKSLNISKIKIDCFDGLTVEFAKKVGATALIRGLRAVSDFDYEFQLATMNKQLNSEIETIFFMTQAKYFYVNSTLIKNIAKFGGKISEFVPKVVEEVLKSKF